MLTGRPPFQRDDTMALMWAQLEAEPPRLTDRRPDLPAAVNAVITTGMSKWPDSRYGNYHEFAASLATACLPEAPPGTAGYAAPDLDVPLAEQTAIDLPPASSGGPGWAGAGWSDAGWECRPPRQPRPGPRPGRGPGPDLDRAGRAGLAARPTRPSPRPSSPPDPAGAIFRPPARPATFRLKAHPPAATARESRPGITTTTW